MKKLILLLSLLLVACSETEIECDCYSVLEGYDSGTYYYIERPEPFMDCEDDGKTIEYIGNHVDLIETIICGYLVD